MTSLDALFPGDGPVRLDGAMGSQLQADGWPAGRPTVLANLEAPGLVSSLHAAHCAAGAQVLVTNSFSALLDADGRGPAAAEAGVRVARKAGGPNVRLAGCLAAFGLASPSAADVLRALVEGGVELLLFETCTSVQAAVLALELAERHAPQLPVVVCASTTDGSHADRDTARAVLAAVTSGDHPRAAAGVNCCRGPHDALRLAAEVEPLVRWIKPSTGLPGEPVDDHVMAAFARAARLRGARYLGGCCGTTPDTLAAMHAALDGAGPS